MLAYNKIWDSTYIIIYVFQIENQTGQQSGAQSARELRVR